MAYPDPATVLSGVVFGASDELTGTLTIPSANDVADAVWGGDRTIRGLTTAGIDAIADEVETRTIPADVVAISGDSGAADALEAMLDGTRAVLYLSQLNIADPPADEAPVKIIGTRSDSGVLPAVYIAGGTANGSEPQNGVEIIGGSYGAGVAQGHAVVLTGGEAPADGGTPGRGLLAIGGAGGASVDGGPGIEARGGAANSGLGGTGMLCKGGSTAGAVAGIGLLCEGAVGSNSQTAGIGARFIGGAGVGDTGIGGVGFSVKGGASGVSIAGPSAVTATGGAGNVTGSAVFPVDADAIADEIETRTLEIDLDGASIDGLANAMRVILAAIAGKVSGMDTNSPAFRDYADTKNRISATTDADGNRSAVTLDAT